MKHERQTLIEDWRQETLAQAHAIIVGCGALGSSLAVSLARLGIGRMTLIDPDVLEEHNLENQAYHHGHIGQTKVHALDGIIGGIDHRIRVDKRFGRVQDVGGLDPGTIMGCLDNVGTRHFISGLSVMSGWPLIDGGIDRYHGVVKTILAGKTACQACYPTLPDAPKRASCASDPIPSTYLTASMTANVMAMQLVDLLRGKDVDGYVRLDLAKRTMSTSTMRPNPDCEICGGVHG